MHYARDEREQMKKNDQRSKRLKGNTARLIKNLEKKSFLDSLDLDAQYALLSVAINGGHNRFLIHG